MYLKDPAVISLMWGRIGAAVCALAAFLLGMWGYAFSPEDQATMVTTIGGVLSGVAGILAIVSKVREGKKASEG